MSLKNLTTLEQRLVLLVAMPTETRRREANKQAIKSLAQELKSLGLFVKEYGGQHPSLVATTKKTKKPTVMLVAHIDVVPAADPSQFEPKVTATKIIGRGTWDMKFAAACYLEFLHEYAEMLKEFDLGVMFTTDEEFGSIDGVAKLLDEGYGAKVALIPDSVSPWHIQAKAKGRLELNLNATGLSTHGSRPWDGINAISNIKAVLNYIDEEFKVTKPEDDTVVVTIFNGGSGVNVIPDKATAALDVRSFDVIRFAEIKNKITEFAAEYSIEVEQIHFREPTAINKNDPYIKKFAGSVKKITGQPVKYNLAHGASDASFFERNDIPAIVFSINGGSQHGPKEYVERKDLPKFYKLLVDFIHSTHDREVTKPAPALKKNIFKRMMSRLPV